MFIFKNTFFTLKSALPIFAAENAVGTVAGLARRAIGLILFEFFFLQLLFWVCSRFRM